MGGPIQPKENGFCTNCMQKYGVASETPCPDSADGKHRWVFPK